MSDTAVLPQARLELPARTDLPLFVYGLLQPGQPAHDHFLSPLATTVRPARLAGGALRLRDGLPLLDPDGEGGVRGYLVTAAPGRGRELYEAVCAFEPRQHYRWLIAEAEALSGGESTGVPVSGGSVSGGAGSAWSGPTPSNVLQGRHPERGSAEEWFSSWSASEDPGLRFGFAQVRRMALEHAVGPVSFLEPDNPLLWERFFALQSCYLLLWSILDRYTAIALGPALEPLARAHLLGADEGFRARVIEAGVPVRSKVADSRDPNRWRRIRDDGTGAVYAWEAVRTTLGHPGRTASGDAALLRRSIVELHDSLRLDVLHRLPALAPAWAELDPPGAAVRWLLRPVVDLDGLA